MSQEREQARLMFGGKKKPEAKKPKTFVPGVVSRPHQPSPQQPTGPSAQDMARIRVRDTH